MRINAISAVRYNSEPKPQPQPAPTQPEQNFKGVWQRLGQYYLDPDKYCAGIFYGFTDGKALPITLDAAGKKIPLLDRLGRELIECEKNGLTVEEGEKAWNFLFEGEETVENSIAVQKLRNFMLTKVSGGKHNVMFLEKTDSADVNAERKPIRLGVVNQKLRDFARKHNLLPPIEATKPEVKEVVEIPNDLLSYLSQTGVA